SSYNGPAQKVVFPVRTAPAVPPAPEGEGRVCNLTLKLVPFTYEKRRVRYIWNARRSYSKHF
ncbi:MAG: hypothetical protein WBM77_02775, partial [Maribacter sp.]